MPIIEIWEVVKSYRDRDNYMRWGGTDGMFYESKEEAQLIADRLNAKARDNQFRMWDQSDREITQRQAEHDALVEKGFRKPYTMGHPVFKPIDEFEIEPHDLKTKEESCLSKTVK